MSSRSNDGAKIGSAIGTGVGAVVGGPTGAAAGAGIGGVVGGITGNAIGSVGNSVLNSFGGGGFGKKKQWTNTGDWADLGISRVGQDTYNKYGDLRNLYNEGRTQDNWATDGRAMGKDYVKKRTVRHGTRTREYDVYGLGQSQGDTAGDYALNQYRDYLLDGGNKGASDWLANQQNAYQSAMNDAYNSQVNDYTNAIQQMIGAGVTDRDAAAFDEAKSKLDAQKAYGYLSDTGYAKALEKLRNQTAMNQDAMRQAGVGAQTQFLSDLGQQYGTIQNNPWDWASNQRDINRDQDWLNFTKWGQDNQLSQGYLNSLMDAANQYTPDEWIAYGAGAQGQYNPYQDFTAGTRKKRKDLNNENINEV